MSLTFMLLACGYSFSPMLNFLAWSGSEKEPNTLSQKVHLASLKTYSLWFHPCVVAAGPTRILTVDFD